MEALTIVVFILSAALMAAAVVIGSKINLEAKLNNTIDQLKTSLELSDNQNWALKQELFNKPCSHTQTNNEAQEIIKDLEKAGFLNIDLGNKTPKKKVKSAKPTKRKK